MLFYHCLWCLLLFLIDDAASASVVYAVPRLSRDNGRSVSGNESRGIVFYFDVARESNIELIVLEKSGLSAEIQQNWVVEIHKTSMVKVRGNVCQQILQQKVYDGWDTT